jgi:hypothetical protein
MAAAISTDEVHPPRSASRGAERGAVSPVAWHRSQPFEAKSRWPSTGSRAMSWRWAVNRNSIRFENSCGVNMGHTTRRVRISARISAT